VMKTTTGNMKKEMEMRKPLHEQDRVVNSLSSPAAYT